MKKNQPHYDISNRTSKKVLFAFLFIFGNLFLGSLIGLIITKYFFIPSLNIELIIQIFLFVLSFFLIIHSTITLCWMLYAWQDPEAALDHRSPSEYVHPYYSFTALLPVRHEEHVVSDTITALNKIDYPDYLKEVIVLCRADDVGTIQKVQETIDAIGNPRILLEIFYDDPINKPHALNKGLAVSQNQIISIFDAEDEPHPEIYHIINTILQTKNVDVVQSGVQLMNYHSHWFSALNCLEYYFWFKSGLHFFSRIGKATPLGGNTVFFKKSYLERVGGWDEECLTEDADIGFRLIEEGAKVHVVYDVKHVTKEETPDTLESFIKQRTRWNQGFLQIFFKFNWIQLPKMRQKIVAAYILLSPLSQALLFLYIPVSLYLAFTVKLPILLVLFSFLPLFLFFLQVTTLIVGMYEFTRGYGLKFPILMPLRILVCFYPYLFILAFASVRATLRFFFGNTAWEKTAHINAHRDTMQFVFAR